MKTLADRCGRRLLLNAEPFGFGPTAAIASFFPHVREHFSSIGFVGKNHTLDLQRALSYDKIHDFSGMGREAEAEAFREIAPSYDVFLTAMDFSMAAHAKANGLKTVLYDALTWYWPRIRDVVKDIDLYIAQNFLGVEERIEIEREALPETRVVSPIIPEIGLPRGSDHVLINLGGLQNPFWKVEDATEYARKMIAALFQVIPDETRLLISTSNAVGRSIRPIFLNSGASPGTMTRLKESLGRSFSRDEMRNLISRSRYSAMTPGLGNIYDVARYGAPTLWLPPANDSQGQQLDLLRLHDMTDAGADWHDAGRPERIDYRSLQSGVLEAITTSIRETSVQALADAFEGELRKIDGKHESVCGALLEQFGTGGDKQVAELLIHLA